ncbi:MAG: YegS/Rv2252/BmrU family lipid kinase [Bacteroidales bacterium]|nr:YegS/Rv2252/BmrU family lipid kinase [Bacteroidales bacterium]MCM1414756.1 YegS/Rv2252/BmrU family lipid kinase [bacterium]MCM1423238.1 YegS/Rv2252/BmrU family lipid kinase [bacterium]
MAKQMLFVYNPRSGKARIRSNFLDIIDIFVKAGYEVTAYPTQASGDAVKAVRERRAGYDIVVCSGGDGTLDEVVTGMMKSDERLPIGYVPAGSTNDFANSLGIPKNMVQAADVVVNGRDFACDVGLFNQGIFIYVAAFGIFTDVSYGTPQDTKNVLGHAAYLIEGVKRLPSVRSYPLKITCNEEVIEGDFLYGMVTNSHSVGGFRGITGQNVALDDGLFEVTLIRRPTNPLDLNNIIVALVDKRVKSEYIYTFTTDSVKVESEEPVAWTLDGEYGGEHQMVEIKNWDRALTIRVPRERY